MEQFKHTLYIIGGTSTALEMRETIDLIDNPYDCIVNVVADGESCRYSFIEDNQLAIHIAASEKKSFIIGFTDQKLRKKFYDLLISNGAELAEIIHPRAYVSKSAKVGKGNYIACNAVISAEAEVGDMNIINLDVTIGHNAIIGNNCIFNPGSRISGNCSIGDRSLFGANSFIYQGVSVVNDCMIDALTYLNQNIEEPSICTSNIAGFKKYKNRAFKY